MFFEVLTSCEFKLALVVFCLLVFCFFVRKDMIFNSLTQRRKNFFPSLVLKFCLKVPSQGYLKQ